MSEGKTETKTEGQGEKTTTPEQRIRLEVDTSKELEELRKQLKTIEDEKKKAQDELEASKAKFKKLEDEKGELEIKTTDYEEKLKMVSEKEYKDKCEVLIGKAKEVFKDEKGEPDLEKIKDITERLEDPEKGPENLKMTEYMLSHLEDMMKKGKAQAEAEEERLEKEKKEAEAKDSEKQTAEKKAGSEAGSTAAGQTPLTSAQTTKEGGEEAESWDSNAAMIQDLRNRARNPKDPERQAEAQAILNELWKRWAKEVKKDYRKEVRRVHDPEEKEIPTLKELQKDPKPRKEK